MKKMAKLPYRTPPPTTSTSYHPTPHPHDSHHTSHHQRSMAMSHNDVEVAAPLGGDTCGSFCTHEWLYEIGGALGDGKRCTGSGIRSRS